MDEEQRINTEFERLLELAGPHLRGEEDVERIRKAFDFACEAHRGVYLGGGEPFMMHPLAVAAIVAQMIGLGTKSICAALLHDVLKNTDRNSDQLRPLFGDKIAGMVESLNNIRLVLENAAPSPEHDSEDKQAEDFKRILLSMGGDMRVVLVKLADRLENCRRLDSLSPEKAERILNESKSIFIPLAHRLGLYAMKSEMENIWLKHRHPEEYSWIENRLNSDSVQRARDIEDFIAPIRAALDESGLQYEIKKRIKTPYSTWHKMHTKGVLFEQIYDLYAVRIIFDCPERSIEAERKRAFDIFTTVTAIYPQNPGRMRDWINQPKPNGYEALHCTLMSRAGIWVEVQIRSRRMDEIAEKGIAAHWSYKDDGYLTNEDTAMDRWLAKVQDILGRGDPDSLELLEMIEDELSGKTIGVFTPKGEQRNILKGATALDFAYLVHSSVGDRAIAAKINSKLAPLSRPLRAGDQVEIITARNSSPKPEWLQFLRTRRARRCVLDALRPNQEALEKAERLMESAPRPEDIRLMLRLNCIWRPGLMEDIEAAVRSVDGIEDAVIKEI